jgi:hypothetical protein
MPAYSLPMANSSPYGLPSISIGTLAYRFLTKARSFGTRLSPVTFSAQTRLTSELLRFL